MVNIAQSADLDNPQASVIERIDALFAYCEMTTPSVRRLAVTLAQTGEMTISDAAERCGLSRTSIRKAAKRLRGLWLKDQHREPLRLCEIIEPQHRGRGYETTLNCPVKSLTMRDSARSETPLTRKSQGQDKASQDDNRPQAPQNQRPQTADARKGVLDGLSDDTVLIRGSRFWRYAMERVRRGAWQLGADRRTSDALTAIVADRIADRPIAEFRRIAQVLNDRGRELIDRVNAALARGIRAAFAACRAVFARMMRGDSVHDENSASDQDGGWNLNHKRDRQSYLDAAREVAAAGGGPCPRCGSEITPWLFYEAPGDAFEDPHRYCSCICIARERDIAEREAARQRSQDADPRRQWREPSRSWRLDPTSRYGGGAVVA